MGNFSEDLKLKLGVNLRKIQSLYVCYISCIQACLIEKQINTESLHAHLSNFCFFDFDKKELKLLSNEKDFHKAETVDEIFVILRRSCRSFLDCSVFQGLVTAFEIDPQNHEFLKYPKHLEAYVDRHELFENFLKTSRKLVLMFNIASVCELAQLKELTSSVANILGVSTPELQLLDVEEGYVVISLLISPSMVHVIFAGHKKFIVDQEQEFPALSVKWLKEVDYSSDFNRVLYESNLKPDAQALNAISGNIMVFLDLLHFWHYFD